MTEKNIILLILFTGILVLSIIITIVIERMRFVKKMNDISGIIEIILDEESNDSYLAVRSDLDFNNVKPGSKMIFIMGKTTNFSQ